MSFPCPYCDGPVSQGDRPKRVNCRYCGGTFWVPALTAQTAGVPAVWVAGVLTILLVNYLRWFY